jgi:hypothetical protein
VKEMDRDDKRRESTDSGVTEGDTSVAPEESMSSNKKPEEAVQESSSAMKPLETTAALETPEGPKKKGRKGKPQEFGDKEKREKVTRSNRAGISA